MRSIMLLVLWYILWRIWVLSPVSFNRHDVRLTEDSMAIALESALGGSVIEFLVSTISDKVFSFNVS